MYVAQYTRVAGYATKKTVLIGFLHLNVCKYLKNGFFSTDFQDLKSKRGTIDSSLNSMT